MIYLRMTDLLLTPPVSHTNTDWQVASDLQFTNIVASSLGDTVNLTNILLTTPLDPGIKYYARGRVLLSTGYTAWSNIDIFSPLDVGAGFANTPLPSLVSIPQFTITNNGLDVPIFNTTVTITAVDTLGTAIHESTSYVLEDMLGAPVWSSLYNIDDLLVKNIPPEVMSPNSVYRLRIMVHTDSRDTAQLVTATIKTEARTHGLLIGGVSTVNPTSDLIIDISPENNVSGVTAILYAIINKKLIQVATYTGTGILGNIITILSTTLTPVTKYILRVNTADTTIWDQRVFTTTV